jgi:predicted DNA-binding transcriptional regulator AlpA
MHQLLTIHQAVMLTGRSEASIRHMIKRGQIPFRKIGMAVMLERHVLDRLAKAS